MADKSQSERQAVSKRASDLYDLTTLSERESEVQAWKEIGLTHEEIADELGIETGTVNSYADRITKKATLAYHTTQEVMGYDELEPYDFGPLLEELIELARNGPLQDQTIQEDLESEMLALDDGTGFRKDGWPPEYDRKKNLLVTD